MLQMFEIYRVLLVCFIEQTQLKLILKIGMQFKYYIDVVAR